MKIDPVVLEKKNKMWKVYAYDDDNDDDKQRAYDMRGISKFLLFSFKLTEETLKYMLYKVIETT